MSSIIQDLIAEGVCVLYFDPRSGSFRDWSGNNNHVTPTAPTSLNRQGARLNFTGQMEVAAAASLDLGGYGESSMVCYFPEGFLGDMSGINRVYGQSNGDYFGCYGFNDKFYLKFNGPAIEGISIGGIDGAHALGFSWVNGAAPDFYRNGLFDVVGGGTLSSGGALAYSVSIGSVWGTYDRQLVNPTGAVLFFARTLTATEHALVYAELRSYDQSWPQKVFARTNGYVRIDPSETSLVIGYNMKPVSGEVIDLSPEGNDGVIVKAAQASSPLGDALRFLYPDSYVTTTYTGTAAVFSMRGWFNLRSRGEGNFGRLLYKNAGIFELFLTSATRMQFRYENGAGTQNLIVENSYTQFLWEHLALIVDGTTIKLYRNSVEVGTVNDVIVLDGSALEIGGYAGGTRDADGDIVAFKWSERALLPAEIAAEYQDGARAINFKTDWGARETVANVTDGFISNTPLVRNTGTWRIVTEVIDEVQCKVLECVASGRIYLPTSIFQVGAGQAAYGTWEWYMNKADASYTQIAFVANQVSALSNGSFDGYAFRFTNGERAQLFRLDNGVTANLTQSAAAYMAVSTWYKCRVARTNAGAFSTYIDDTPVDTDGGGGTNPVTDTTYTDSPYMVLDLDAGDKISFGDVGGDHAFIKFLGAVIFSTDGDFPV